MELLSGPEAGALLASALESSGGRSLGWTVTQVDHDRTTVTYAVRVEWADGTVSEETLGAAVGEVPAGVLRLTDGDTEIGLWRYPFDPDLPGLAAACDPARMTALANRLGLEATRR